MRSQHRTALVLLAAGGALAFFAYGQTWVVLTAHVAGLPATSRTVSGRELEPAAGVLPLLLLAAVLAVWATSGWVRRAVGVLAVAASLVVLVAAVRSSPALLSTDVPVRFELVGVPSYSVTAWWLPAAAGAVLGLAGGVLVAAYGHRWPGFSDRYRREPAAAPAPSGPLTERQAWDLLDEGQDPTAGAPDPVAAGSAEPAAGTMPSGPPVAHPPTPDPAGPPEEDTR